MVDGRRSSYLFCGIVPATWHYDHKRFRRINVLVRLRLDSGFKSQSLGFCDVTAYQVPLLFPRRFEFFLILNFT